MALALASIRTNIYTTVYNHLQTGTYAITSNNIHPSYNDAQLQSEGFPQVIINNITVPEEKLTFGTKGMYNINISFNIHVHHSSAVNSRAVADEVCSKFKGDGKAILETAKLNNVKLNSETYERIPYAVNRSDHVHLLEFTGRYMGAT